MSGDVTVEENIREYKDEKKYTKMCDTCNFVVKANKKYISLQQLKRHMRDEHNKTTRSTSPPMKKKKVDEKNDMISDNEHINKPEVMDLSESLEEMDIGDSDTESGLDENDLLAERSKMMDAKVKAK